VNVDSLIIETTRRCNAKCDHCLRGDIENVDLQQEYVDSLFSKLSYVGSVTFTGGEPSLVPEVIGYAIDAAEKYGVTIGSFYIATNAINITDAFLLVIMRLWCFCDDNEISQVNWSNDEFHPTMNTRKLEAFSFASAKYDPESRYNAKPSIIAEGRGTDWDVLNEGRVNSREAFEVDEDDIREGNVYLNCEGYIVGGCDWSFESQRDWSNIISTVEEFSLAKVEEFEDDFERSDPRRAADQLKMVA
jgi:hypothetical protein